MKTVLDTFKKEEYELYGLVKKYNELFLERENYSFDDFSTNLTNEEKKEFAEKRIETENMISMVDSKISELSKVVSKKISDELNEDLFKLDEEEKLHNKNLQELKKINSMIENCKKRLEFFEKNQLSKNFEELNNKLLELMKAKKEYEINGITIADELARLSQIKEEREKTLEKINLLEKNFNIYIKNYYSNNELFKFLDLLQEGISAKENNDWKEKAKKLKEKTLLLKTSFEKEKLNQFNELYDKLFKSDIEQIKNEIKNLEDKIEFFKNNSRNSQSVKEVINNTKKQIENSQELLEKINKLKELDEEISLEILTGTKKNKEIDELPYAYDELEEEPNERDNFDSEAFLEFNEQEEKIEVKSKIKSIMNIPIKEEYSKELKELISRVNENDFEALEDLSDAYLYGEYDLTINYELSFKLMKIAEMFGRKGYCQYALGYDYGHGVGVEQDLDKALQYLKKAKKNGYKCDDDIDEILELKNSSLAVEEKVLPLLKIKSKDTENSRDDEFETFEVETEYSEELKDLIIKANAGDTKSLENLAVAYSAGKNSRYCLNRDDELSFKLMQESERLGGEGHCQYSIAHCYKYGVGVEQDLDKALEYYKKAYKNGIGCDEIINFLKVELLERVRPIDNEVDNSLDLKYSKLGKIEKIIKISDLPFKDKWIVKKISAVASTLKEKIMSHVHEEPEEDLINNFKILKKKADSGDVYMQYRLADYYYFNYLYEEALYYYSIVNPHIDCSLEIKDIQNKLKMKEEFNKSR